MRKVRHSTIHEKALLLDRFVDYFMKARRRRNFPHKQVKALLPLLFPRSRWEGRGAYKTVHKISSRNGSRDLVLKASNERNIKQDMDVYHQLAEGVRNRHYAKIYWSTKYFLL